MVAQALVRWDHAGFARRELIERAELHLPPAWRVARLDGPVRGVESLLAQAEADGFEVLGPVAPPPVHGQVAPSGTRALVRSPLTRGRALLLETQLHLISTRGLSIMLPQAQLAVILTRFLRRKAAKQE